jgi:hypothetical protein
MKASRRRQLLEAKDLIQCVGALLTASANTTGVAPADFVPIPLKIVNAELEKKLGKSWETWYQHRHGTLQQFLEKYARSRLAKYELTEHGQLIGLKAVSVKGRGQEEEVGKEAEEKARKEEGEKRGEQARKETDNLSITSTTGSGLPTRVNDNQVRTSTTTVLIPLLYSYHYCTRTTAKRLYSYYCTHGNVLILLYRY